RPSAEPTLAACRRIACLVRNPRCRRRSVVACNAMPAMPLADISTIGRILLTLHDRSCYFFSGCDFDRDGIGNDGLPSAGCARADGRGARRPAVRAPVRPVGLPPLLPPHPGGRAVRGGASAGGPARPSR